MTDKRPRTDGQTDMQMRIGTKHIPTLYAYALHVRRAVKMVNCTFGVTAPCPIIGDNRLPRFSSTHADVYRPHAEDARTQPSHRVGCIGYSAVLYIV